MVINDAKENDLLFVTKSFSFYSENFYREEIKKGSIILVLDNNFGPTYKERSAVFLIKSKKIKVKATMHNELFRMSSDSNLFKLISLQ